MSSQATLKTILVVVQTKRNESRTKYNRLIAEETELEDADNRDQRVVEVARINAFDEVITGLEKMIDEPEQDKHYLVTIFGGVESDLEAFDSEAEVLKRGAEIIYETENNSVHQLDISSDGVPTLYDFSGGQIGDAIDRHIEEQEKEIDKALEAEKDRKRGVTDSTREGWDN